MEYVSFLSVIGNPLFIPVFNDNGEMVVNRYEARVGDWKMGIFHIHEYHIKGKDGNNGLCISVPCWNVVREGNVYILERQKIPFLPISYASLSRSTVGELEDAGLLVPIGFHDMYSSFFSPESMNDLETMLPEDVRPMYTINDEGLGEVLFGKSDSQKRPRRRLPAFAPQEKFA